MSNTTFVPVDFDPFAEESKFRTAPTTEPQREIFTNIQIGGDPANLAYNESVSLKLKGSFDVNALDKAADLLLARHEALRATFSNDGLRIQIANELEIEVEKKDFSDLDKEEKEKKLNAEIAKEVQTPFDLTHGPLIRISLIKLEEELHHILLTIHHIVGDGWSLGMCMIDLSHFYSAIKNNTKPTLEPADSWIEYAYEEENYAAGNENEKTENYWLSKYAGSLPVIDLSLSKSRPAIRTFAAERIDVSIKKDTVEKLKLEGAKAGCSFVTTMTAAFEVYLQRITGNEDVVVGLPAAGQSVIGKQNLIGHCVQLLPLRTQVKPKEKFIDYLKQRKKTLLDDFDHQRYTFGSLLRKLNIQRDPSRIPLVPVSFNIDIGITNGVEFAGLDYEFSTNPRCYENFEWFINCSGTGNHLVIECTYNTDLFDKKIMEYRMEEFTVLLDAIVANPESLIYELAILPQSEIQLLNQWNKKKCKFPEEECVHNLVEDAALKFKDKTAIEFSTRKITYAELNRQANQLANYLLQQGIKQGDTICISLNRSIEMVVAILATMKSGAAYIPVDPDFPQERITYMIENSRSKSIITSSSVKEKMKIDGDFILMDDGWQNRLTGEVTNPKVQKDPYQLAYIIYTSGSTGLPKGVQIQHRSFVNLLWSFKKDITFSESDNLLAITTVSFDIAGLELFLPLINGAKLVIASKDDGVNPTKLKEYFETKNISTFQATPATFKMLQSADWNPDKQLKLLVGGEAVSTDLAHYLTSVCNNVWNVYGPTETTIWSTCYKIPKTEFTDSGTTLIGKPIDNTSIYILDEFYKIKPINTEGDLFISGEGLSPGYFGQPDLTDDRFIYAQLSNDEITRIYKTGDKGKILPDGNIEYTGRSDFQVKIRGYRIELGEIEAIIRQHTSIADAVVHVKNNKQNDKILVAYFISDKDDSIIIEQLKELITEKLPVYMMPSSFVKVEKFPLTANGKIDRKALPEPEIVVKDTSVDDSRNEILQQQTSTEESLVDIWKEILNLSHVGIKDNFFELGGHSLIGVQLFIEIEKRLGVKLNLQSLFKSPTIESLAKIIDKEESTIEWKPLVALQPNGTRTPLFCVHMHNGNIYRWKVLEKYLPSDQPIYAIQPRALDETQEPQRNIVDMAKYYVEVIREVQSHGPYNLAGLCFGGMVVFEMALQLQALGEKVELAAMVNTYAPLQNQSYYRLRKEVEGFMKLDIGDKLNYAIQKNLNIGKKLKNKALNIFNKSTTQQVVSDPIQEDIRFIHTLALMNYQPKQQYNGNLFVIKTGGPVEDPEFYDNTLGWQRLVNGKVEMMQVEDSNNDTIIENNLYNSQLAQFIKNKLDQINTYKEETFNF